MPERSPAVLAALAAFKVGNLSQGIALLEGFLADYGAVPSSPDAYDYWQAQMYLVQAYDRSGQEARAKVLCQQVRQGTAHYPQIHQWAAQRLQQWSAGSSVGAPTGGAPTIQQSMPSSPTPRKTTPPSPSAKPLQTQKWTFTLNADSWAHGAVVLGILAGLIVLIYGLLPGWGLGRWSLAGGLAIVGGLGLMWGAPRGLDFWVNQQGGGHWVTEGIPQLAFVDTYYQARQRSCPYLYLVPGAEVWGYGTLGQDRLVIGEDLLQQLQADEVEMLVTWVITHLERRHAAVLTWASAGAFGLWGLGMWVGTGVYPLGLGLRWLSQGLFYPLGFLARWATAQTDAQMTDAALLMQALIRQAAIGQSTGIPCGVLAVSDPLAWQRFALSSRHPQVLAWELRNPWSRWVGVNTNQPLPGQRLYALGQRAKAQGRQPWLDLNAPLRVNPPAGTLLLYTADLGGILLGWGLGLGLFWPGILGMWGWLGASLVVGGVGMLLKAFGMFPALAVAPEQSVLTLLSQPQANPVIGIPVVVRGTWQVVGDRWLVRDGTGGIPVQWLGSMPVKSGSPVVVKGWLRRGARVWIDGALMTTQQGTLSAWPRLPLLLGGILLVAVGLGCLGIPAPTQSSFY